VKDLFDICTPRKDVLRGHVKESDFAADLAQVLNQTAPPEYQEPKVFFANTHPTRGLKDLLKNVGLRLTGKGGEASAIFRLDTQYGGGKTHALIALTHMASGMPGVASVEEFIDSNLVPKKKVRVAAFDGENADPVNGRPLGQGLRAYTPWGELAFALAGVEGFEQVRASDQQRVAPGAENIRELFGGEPLTTNNRMELTAVIRALQALTRPSRVAVHTDSQYVQKGVSEWLRGWKARGWKTADKKPVKNVDLWRELDGLVGAHRIDWHWVRGHAGHPENERADALANRGVDAVR